MARAAADSSGGRSSPPPPPASVVITVSSGGTSAGESSGQALESTAATERGANVVVDVGGGGGGPVVPEAEEVCRICHLSPEIRGSGGAELIRIGCGCKGQLGIAHQRCAEAWFRVKGNRCCEICGVNAENVVGKEDGGFMEEWNERMMPSLRSNRNSSVGWWRGQPFCNLLMAFLIVIFVLSWFFRMNLF